MGAPARIAWCLVLGAPLVVGTVSQPAQALREAVELRGSLWTAPGSVTGLLRAAPPAPGPLDPAIAAPGMAAPGGSLRSPWQETLSSAQRLGGALQDPADFAYSLGATAPTSDTHRLQAGGLKAESLIDDLLDPPRPGSSAPRPTPAASVQPRLSAGVLSEAAVLPQDQRTPQEQFMTSQVNEFMQAAVNQTGLSRQCLDSATYTCEGQGVSNGRMRAKPVYWNPVAVKWGPSQIEHLKRQR